MSGIDDALIDDVRALLASFRRGGLADFSATLRPGVELTLRRAAPASDRTRTLVAPHVATIAELPAIGAPAAGVELELLGAIILLPFEDGEVAEEYLVSVGDLVEFGTAIARLSRAR